MSDKNFKVKNGLDANGAVTITQPSTSTVPLTILANTLATGSNLLEVKRPDGTVRLSIGNDGAFSAQNLTAYNVRFYSAQTGSSGLIIRGLPSQTADLQQWRDINETVLASVSASGSISAVDLTLSGNLTVNGTTTNLNSTNLVIEDKNIIIADVATPTDTTADGAGITIKGATDKALNWVQSTGSFTSSDPFIINTTSTTRSNLIVKAIASQTSNLTEWQNSLGSVVAKIDSNAIFNSLNSGSGADSYSSIIIGGRWIRNEQRANLTRFGVNTGEWHLASNPDNSAIAITDSQVGVFATSTTLPLLTVKGMASQSGNLQEWQDSTGYSISRVDSGGSHWINGIPATSISVEPSSAYLYLTSNRWTGSASTAEVFGINNFRFGGTGAAGAFALHLKPASSANAYLSIAGDSSRSVGVNVQYPSASSGYGQFGVQINDASYKGVVVKAAASQTANLQEWQNSAGTVLSRIDANGIISLPGGSWHLLGGFETWYKNSVSFYQKGASHTFRRQSDDADLFTIGGNGNTAVLLNSASSIGLTVKGAASQTANLQEWQDSTGTVLSSINASGNLILGNQYISHTGASGYGRLQLLDGGTNQTTLYPASAGLLIGNAGVAGMSVVKVRGASGQTGNLTEWQDSAGTVAASINSGGSLSLSRSLYTSASLGVWASVNINPQGGSTGNALTIQTYNTTSKGIVILGQASQTANLQEWQNSAGGVLAYVSSDGTFQNTGDINSGSTIRLGSGASSAGGYPVFAIKNATVAPTSNPTNGGVIYVESGSLKYRGQGGAITTIASSSLDDQEDIENSEVQLIQYGAEGSVLQNLPTRIHPAEQLLKESVLWLDPAHSSAGSQTIQNLGWGGTALNATAGENTSVSTDEPKYLSWEGENYIYATGETGNFIMSSASTSLGMTTSSDLDMRVKVSLDALSGINQMFISTWWYRLHLTSSGYVSLSWHDNTAFNNINSSNLLSSVATVGQEIWIRGTLKLNNGSGVSEVKFYTSINGTTWTQLGTTYNGASTSILGAGGRSLSLEVGSLDGGVASVVSGKIYRTQVLQGVDGVVVFDCDTSLVSSGSATTFNALTGHIMTITRNTVGRKMVAVTHPLWLFGTNDFLKIAHNNLLDFATNQPFTIFLSSREFASTAGTTILLAKGGYGVWQGYTLTSFNSSTQAYFSGPQANTSYYYSGNLGKSTTLRNYFYGRSTTNTFSYVNNNLIGGSEEVAPQYDTSNNYDFYLGRQTTGQNSNMEVFGVAIWRRALTSAEIATVSRYYEGRAI